MPEQAHSTSEDDSPTRNNFHTILREVGTLGIVGAGTIAAVEDITHTNVVGVPRDIAATAFVTYIYRRMTRSVSV
jgi:hypothetical protein